ncbi:uncharacterized protein LOC117884359 [Trachemys scripta elegans]|uniref:uncharacterized protein LOC117884359 n=1 Tax=Trachemys scripta elegans TaxID=31138 RepID=UPI001552E688|nr:uncharacterized protein LOC117884359 [Trachemys scripta elegans]XP_034640593.1 uncharacterized protein LOC117884359 [Trachemys scripta elegans]
MTTKFSPYRLLYGFEPRFPDQVSDKYTPTDLEQFDEEYYKDYIMKNEGSRDAETKVAITNISNAQEKQQIQYAKTKTRKHGEITFKVDDTVLLLNVRRKTRKGGQQDPTYVEPYKIAAVEGKRVKLENKLGKGLATLYSISQLKVFKEPPKLGEENISQRNIEKETAVDDTVKTSEVGEMGGNVSHKPHNSQVEVTHTEKEECVVSGVSSSHPGDFDDMVMEDDEEREWFLKGIAYHTSVFKRFC